MTIVIAGGGIGGLAAALSLHAAGCRDVAVYERAAGFHPDALNSRPSLTPPSANP